MTYLIPLTIIAASLAGILAIVFRKARILSAAKEAGLARPEVVPSSEEGVARDTSRFPSPKTPAHELGRDAQADLGSDRTKLNDTFVIITEKFFRKMRIRLMKIENMLTSITNRLHEKVAQRRARRTNGEASGGAASDTNVLAQEKESDVAREKDTAGKEDRPAPPSASFIRLNENNTKFDEEYWLNVIKQDRKSFYPYKKLGEIYFAREDFREARAVLKYATKLDPNDSEVNAMMQALKGKRARR